MKFHHLVIALAFLAVSPSDSWGQSEQPSPQSKQSAQPSASDQRGTDQVPLAVKILPAQDTEKQAEKAERDRKEKAAIDEKTAFETQRIADYTDRLAVFTGLLFCIAVLQIGLFFWQLLYMRKGLKDAEIAADAAKTSADALMKAQRAYVRLSHVRGASVLISGGSASINIQLQAQNWGETPARISAIAMNAIFSAPNILLPTTPPYSAAEERDAFLFRKEEFFDTWTIPVNVTDASAVLSGTLSLYLVGYIDYIDAFDVRRRGGYAREYNGSPPAANNLNLVTQAGYNYDLPRDRSQGIDWNRKI